MKILNTVVNKLGIHRNSRSAILKRNISFVFFFKALSIFISFYLIPLSLKLLDEEKYGIWLTISSILGWFTFFDLGLTNGLKNELGKSFANNDFPSAKKDVSSAFYLLAIILIILGFIFFISNIFINWQTLLNTTKISNIEIFKLIAILFFSFILNSLFGIIFTVLSSNQNSIIPELYRFSTNFLSIILLFLFKTYFYNSLLFMSLATSVTSSIIAIFFYYFYFNTDYKNIKPNFKYFSFSRAKNLLGKSSLFFVIQISALILFMSDNLIISKLFKPEDVVPYNIAYKLFNIVVVFFSIITTPLWAAITDANHKNDFMWIEKTILKLKKLWYLTSIGLVSILLLSSQIYKFWVGPQINISISISISMCLFVLIHTYNTIYVTFIFAVGKTRLQAFLAIIAAVINIPMSIFFAKYLNIGPAGVILATAFCGLPNVLISRLQYYKIKNKIDNGIWSK